jgi:hypothetical protein
VESEKMGPPDSYREGTITKMSGPSWARSSDPLKDVIKVTRYSGTKEITDDRPKFKLIKSHTGRRSFSRILSMMLVAEEIISEEMGHNGKSITRHYIGNSDHMNRIFRAAYNCCRFLLQSLSSVLLILEMRLRIQGKIRKRHSQKAWKDFRLYLKYLDLKVQGTDVLSKNYKTINRY